MERQIERIDGTDYVIGTPEYAFAKRQQSMRLDATYLQAHAPLFERNVRLLRGFEGLDYRIRADANASAFLARELVFVRGEVERTIYQRLRAAEFVPVETGHPAGALSYATQRMEVVGEAMVSHDLSGDAPRADALKSEELGKYTNVRSSYAYSVQDLEFAAFSGTPLQRWKAEACAEMIARKLDRIGRSGTKGLPAKEDVGLTGFFNNPAVTVHTLSLGEWISTATNAEIIADWNELETALIAACGDNLPPGEKPFRFVVSALVEGALASRQVDNTNVSLKTYLLANSRIIGAIERYSVLDTASGVEIAAADAPMGVIYPRSPAVLWWPIPIVYMEQPPQLDGWEWLVQARARCGGVEFRRPFWARYVENLD